MKAIIDEIVRESVRVKEEFIKESYSDLMLCGNGGSAADAQHIAAEFVNRLEMERPPLPAISLAADSSIITCIGNDYSFDDIFTKQVKAIGLEGDVLLAISTSGNSQNIVSAAEAASEMGIYVAALTGCKGGKLKDVSDLCLIVPSDRTARIQESHILAGHIICKLVDHILFQGGE
jgi:D-sedoheptulose 7-phosphate isomerase